MKLITCLSVAFALALAVSGENQKILRRVIKSTPTATSLGRIRTVTIRSTASTENGAVSEISSKEAANFGQRSANETTSLETTTNHSQQSNKLLNVKTRQTTSTTPSPTTTSTTSTASTPTTTTTSPSTTTSRTDLKHRASERQQQAEVELLSSAPSSWQAMSAVEAPAAMLIATGVRAASTSSASTSDLSQSSSNLHLSEDLSNGDVLRSSATKGSSSYTQQDSIGDQTFSRLRQQSTKQQKQTFFYPQQAPIRASKTNNQATKTHWYQPPSTTPKPAPIIQQQEQQQYEQQNEQYVEQQAEYNAAPLGQAEPFAFDFNTKDNRGNGQYRKEESDKNGVVRGSYGYTDANGIYRHVEYVADQNGFRANIKSNEPGLIGETQPASIQLASGSGSATARLSNNNNQDNGDNGQWNSLSNNDATSADLALAPPDFESSHKSDRIREPRHFRN